MRRLRGSREAAGHPGRPGRRAKSRKRIRAQRIRGFLLVDSFCTLFNLLSKKRIRFPWVSGGFLESRIREGTPRGVCCFSNRNDTNKSRKPGVSKHVVSFLVSKVLKAYQKKHTKNRFPSQLYLKSFFLWLHLLRVFWLWVFFPSPPSMGERACPGARASAGA